MGSRDSRVQADDAGVQGGPQQLRAHGPRRAQQGTKAIIQYILPAIIISSRHGCHMNNYQP